MSADSGDEIIKYKVIVVPIFDGDYAPGKGGSKYVKNLSEDNLYRNGDKIEVEVDVTAKAKVKTDCSGFDSEYTAEDETVTAVGGEGNKYKVEYTLDADNTKATDMGKLYTLPITCRDVEETNTGDSTSTMNTGDRFKIYLDNSEPTVGVSVSPSWFWVSKEESPDKSWFQVSFEDKWESRPTDVETYGVNEATDVVIKIYDGSDPEAGTLIKTIDVADFNLDWKVTGSKYQGTGILKSWDGSKDGGGEVSPGVFWVYAEAKDAAGNVGWNHTEAMGIANTVAADPSFIQASRRAPWIIRRIRMLENR